MNSWNLAKSRRMVGVRSEHTRDILGTPLENFQLKSIEFLQWFRPLDLPEQAGFSDVKGKPVL